MNKTTAASALGEDTVGIYLHIPFCLGKCYYCDFCSEAVPTETKAAYVNALCREISRFDGRAISVDTLFFGGGTPSLLLPAQVEQVLDALHARFSFSKDVECSMEVNPATVTREKAKAFVSLGINRFSVGIQSFSDRELHFLGRRHTAEEAVACVRILREAGNTNLNIDLMYGLAGQTTADFRASVEKALSLAPEHLSAYALSIEEGTPLHANRHAYTFPSDDEVYEMYGMLTEKMKNSGYRHYEISNFAKEGYRCRHNLRYWEQKQYIGFGTAAHSYFGGRRYANGTKLADYINGTGQVVCEGPQTKEAMMAERVMLALRLDTGISEELLAEVAPPASSAFVGECERAGYLSRRDGHIRLTDDGMYVSNSILCGLLP